jgi:Mrp family chromosome partitioning ATPase
MSSDVSPFEPTLVGAILRHWRLVLVVITALVIPAGLYVSTRPAEYTAKSSLIVADPRGPGVLGAQNPAVPERYVADQLAVFTSATLAGQAAENGRELRPPLNHSPGWFLSHASAKAVAKDNNVISITVKGSSAAEAMAAARAVTSAYSDVVKKAVGAEASAIKAQLDASISSIDASLTALSGRPGDPNVQQQAQQLTDTRATLDARRDQVGGEVQHPNDGVKLALLPDSAQSPGKSAAVRALLLAILLGTLIGGALAYLQSYRHRIFTDSADPEIVLGAPMLVDVSSVPVVDIFGHTSPKERDVSRLAEMFGILAAFIADAVRNRAGSGVSIAIVSGDGGAAGTAVAWRTALALSSQGLKVLVVDADGSWQPTPRWLEGAAEPVTWNERPDGTFGVDLVWSAERPVCFSGEPPDVRFPASRSDVFREVEKRCDVVLIVTPRFLDSSTAAALTTAAGRAIVIANDGGSVGNTQELARRLRLTDVLALGYVYCGRPTFLERPRRSSQPPDRAVRDGAVGVEREQPQTAPGVSAPWPRPRVAPGAESKGATKEQSPIASSVSARWPSRPRAAPD